MKTRRNSFDLNMFRASKHIPFLLFTLSLFTFFSCTVEKRHYRKGFYVQKRSDPKHYPEYKTNKADSDKLIEENFCLISKPRSEAENVEALITDHSKILKESYSSKVVVSDNEKAKTFNTKNKNSFLQNNSQKNNFRVINNKEFFRSNGFSKNKLGIGAGTDFQKLILGILLVALITVSGFFFVAWFFTFLLYSPENILLTYMLIFLILAFLDFLALISS